MDETLQTSRHPLMLRPPPMSESKSSARRLLHSRFLQNGIGLYGVKVCTWGDGFDISVSREILLQRPDPRRLSKLVSGVLKANSYLSLCRIAGTIFSRRF